MRAQQLPTSYARPLPPSSAAGGASRGPVDVALADRWIVIRVPSCVNPGLRDASTPLRPYFDPQSPRRTVIALMGWSSASMAARYQHVTDPMRRRSPGRPTTGSLACLAFYASITFTAVLLR